ncbi:transcriptional regulator (plasmid) [Sulfitobacter alexandrii]|uniref:Transcriptional regulator n=1 Tax=Sulfitobacter alexandrii TaxID=1917485 RepID=A0A1J0WMW6_9RHOB|nr:LacI family DNA-binding transcriptional regulator [Sulfitobacter alexandrii]APE45605.1 transcriptional regulator [Sulfitobacter alexandrii]
MAKKQSDKVDIVYVAKVAGVSPATVSRAINHPELVSPATRKKIDSAIRKSGYIRNRAAQAIHGRRSATIGFVVPTLNYAIFAEVVQSFNDEASTHGFTLLLASHGYDLDAEYQVMRKLLEHRVDGLALIGFDHSADSMRLIEEQRVPLLSVWNYDADSRMSCVGADNAEAGRRAAEHLLRLGHRHIGLVFPPTAGNDRAQARLAAVEKTLADAGVTVPDAWRGQTLYSVSRSKAVCGEILSGDERPTALLCGNDIIAYGAVYAAIRLGLSIPGDLSIIGIGDFTGSADMEPALTTVRIPARTIGTTAARHLVKAIADREGTGLVRERLDLELIMRDTTAPPA